MKYLKVIVNNNSKSTDNFFTYILNSEFENEVRIGHRILVPFGNTNKPIEAYVFGILDEYEGKFKLKEILEVLDEAPMLSSFDIDLIDFIREKYICTYMDAINCLYPKGFKLKSYKIIILNDFELDLDKLSNSQREIVTELLRNNGKIKSDNIKGKNKALIELKEKKIIDIIWKSENCINEKKYYSIKINESIKDFDCLMKTINKNAHKQKMILNYLKENGEVLLDDLLEKLHTNKGIIKALKEKNYITLNKHILNRNPKNIFSIIKKNVILNEEQTNVFNILNENLNSKYKKKFLLFGVTGSGKTQIYIEIINKALKKNLSAIILVPEISLTPQTIAIFKSNFSKDLVAVFHSKLSEGEKHDEYIRVKKGEAKIIIGARSAIFAPCDNLGVIIIDEFHDSSYKSEMNPKYNTVEIANYISKIKNVMVILGSATPSIDEYYKDDEYEKLTISKRANNMPMPEIEIIDMKEELDYGNKSIFSRELYNAINTAISNDEQVILFLNRRGYASFISCRKCSHTFKCKNCDISLTYHKNENIGVCHYCGYEMKIPNICPECKSSYIKQFGIGTQKVEEEVYKYFENALVLRIDKDTTSKKNSLEIILNKFKDKKANVLIGTQMISKGLDFPNVTVVGVLCFDMMLNFPDYKSSEKTFQMISQVSGRAGRADLKGRVIVQGYEVDNYVLKYVKEYDYFGFYQDEIKIRKAFNYPPFNNIVCIVISGQDEKRVIKNAQKLYDSIKYMLNKRNYNNFDFIFGPNPCTISKINLKYRWQILLKDLSVEISFLKGIIKYICIQKRDIIFDKDISLSIDVNPNSIL